MTLSLQEIALLSWCCSLRLLSATRSRGRWSYAGVESGRFPPLSHLGEEMEERGGQHAVRLLHNEVKRCGNPVQNGPGNHL